MKLLLDQGLPRSAVASLSSVGVESIHVGDLDLSKASDERILEYARDKGLVIVTFDADFHSLMALSGARNPSVIRIRQEGLKADDLARLLRGVIDDCSQQIEQGALIAVTNSRLRLRKLPLAR